MIKANYKVGLISAVLALLFVYVANFDFLLFHTVAEFSTVVVGFLLSVIVLNTYELMKSSFFLFLGLSYGFSSTFDFIHLMYYKGLLSAPYAQGSDLPTQTWVIARFMNVISLLFAFFYLKRQSNPWCAFSGYLGLSGLLVLSLFVWRNFPPCFVEGQGLTNFKIWSEYAIIFGDLIAFFSLWKNRASFHKQVYAYLQAFLTCSIIMEACFTLYISVYGLSNMMGHIFKLFAYYFLYKAVIETSFKKPYELLFYDLNAANQELLAQTEELSQLTNRLELEVEDKKKLADDMIKAKNQAEKANQVKSDFLALISHEIRTPLNGILGMTGLMLQESLTARQRESMSLIHESGRLLLTIINDVLDYSKIEAEQMKLEKIEFVFSQLIQETVQLFVSEAAEKGLSLSCEVDEALPKVLVGDPIRIRQILLNLISNAIKFTPKGKVAINVKCLANQGSEVKLRISVKDTGIGISPETQAKLFQPFQQADISTTRQYGGTGLGLSICQRLIQMMEGRLVVQSQVNEGSTFSIDLTLPKGSNSLILQHQACSLLPSDSPATQLPLKAEKPILLVEDNVINCKVVASWLERFGLSVEVVQDGAAAVEAVARSTFSLILMDCQMPKLDGYEASRKIRSMKGSGERVPIIAMTASALVGDKEKCLAAGMNDYLAKPFEPEELYGLMNKWLNQEAYQGIDSSKLKQILPPVGMSQEEWLKEVLELYLESSAPQLDKLGSAIGKNEYETTWKIAHQLKSGTATVGAMQLSDLLKQCELAGKNQEQQKLRSLWPLIEEEYKQSCQIFQSLLQGNDPFKANDKEQ